MEIKTHIGLIMAWRIIIISGIISLVYACSYSEKKISHLSGVVPSEHTLLAITPDVSIKVIGDSLNKSYPQLRTGKAFPITGILCVDSKAYRFMGGDSLRISPLAPLSEDTIGWTGKYSFLYPGKGWEQGKYNDSLWSGGNGAFGSAKGYYYPVHTLWGVENIYVRRHVNVDNKDVLKDHKVYVRYVCDDRIKLFCNGEYLLGEETVLSRTGCYRLTDGTVAQIVNGDNVLAAYCRNTGGPALLDFGLYIENKTYADAEPATLKKMNVQATQTQFIFQCGEVELQIDFVSPSLSEKWDMTGWPVGFISYQVCTESGKHTVEILFDVDTEWMFGKRKIDSWAEQDWRFVKSDSLYLAMTADETTFSCMDGHAVLSQKLYVGNGEDRNSGVLLVGYEEGQVLQYDGEVLSPLWNSGGTREVKELMKSVGNRYKELKAECALLDSRWNSKAFQAGNKAFAERMLPAYRNFVSSHRFMSFSGNKLFCLGDTLGNVREAYKSFPVLLSFHRTDWMRGLLDPIFEYCEDIHWSKKYPPYDIGLYPVASKQVKLEDCAVEAAANMLMMTTAVVEAEQDFSYADIHWGQLCLWASYLEERMKNMIFPSVGLLEHDDERVKCVLGLMAYRKLIQLKGSL
ncbi:DUF4965 domain-containing protein [Bacteroides sp. AN502(2024)]|uniref:glutaminase domain-containing protein n=1 Tax=Bacteroides sp. AN502(2024) TaxID=3160599 RepID=UPI003511682F